MADNLQQLARLVAAAVSERLGDAQPDVVEVVVREVLGAMSEGVPAPSTRPPAADNGDGTITTGLGAVLPRPAGPATETSLELCTGCVEQTRQQNQHRAVITTTGRNARGVVATVAKEVADAGGDIQDISQTIVSDYFTMIMVVDISSLVLPFAGFKERLLAAAEQLGIHLVVMHEEVMRSLQRV